MFDDSNGVYVTRTRVDGEELHCRFVSWVAEGNSWEGTKEKP